MRIFDDIGLRERVLSLGNEFPAGVSAQIERRLFTFEFPGVPDAERLGGITIAPQRELLELLAEEAVKRPEFALIMGCSVRELIWENDRVAGVRGHLHDGEHVAIRAPITVACDGRFSAVRRAAAIELEGARVAFDLLWFSTPVPAGSPNRVHVRIRGGELFVSFPSRSNRMQVGWFLRKGAFASLRSRPFSACVAHIASHVPHQLSDSVRTTLAGWESLALLPVVSQSSRRWVRPGLLLIGDAAHPMSPAGGQGINVAIYDAVVSARHLAGAIRAGESLDDAARAVEAERRPPVAATQRQQNAATGILTFLGPSLAFKVFATLLRAGVRMRIRPNLLRRTIDRFLWGDPEVRANCGPWKEA